MKATFFRDDGSEAEAVGKYFPTRKGSVDLYGAPIEPDDEESMDFLYAVDDEGKELEISEQEYKRAMEALWENDFC